MGRRQVCVEIRELLTREIHGRRWLFVVVVASGWRLSPWDAVRCAFCRSQSRGFDLVVFTSCGSDVMESSRARVA